MKKRRDIFIVLNKYSWFLDLWNVYMCLRACDFMFIDFDKAYKVISLYFSIMDMK